MSQYYDERFPFPSPGRLRRELHLGRPPGWMIALGVLGLLGLLALPVALWFHVTKDRSQQPRVHLIQDMDVQPRLNPQAASKAFADGRAMRLPVDGTVARGQWIGDDHYEQGYRIAVDPQTDEPTLFFFEGLPPQIVWDEPLLTRGKIVYDIYCAVCHGASGKGEGSVNQWALANDQPGWVAATNLLDPMVRERTDGYLYNAIRKGIRSMPGYGSQIEINDRWAVVAYLRHLQQAAPADPSSPQE